MDNIRKIKYFLTCLLAVGLMSCSNDNDDITTGYEGILDDLSEEVNVTVQELWSTSPLTLDAKRTGALAKIQGYADNCLSDYFSTFLSGYDQTSENMEKADPILIYYRSAFDRVLEDIKNSSVEEGTVELWQLYNMGYVVKTSSGCFAIDISHRWAKELAPYIDFLCVTHNHADHYNKELIQAMFDLGKPVLSNYLQDESYEYTSKTPTDYTIGDFAIHTSITDHNNSGLSNFVTVF